MPEPDLIKRILWAVDALEDCPDIDEACLKAIQALGADSDSRIEPVYVIPPERLTTPFQVIYPPFGNFGAGSEELLNDRLRQVSTLKLEPLRFLTKPTTSTTGAVKELCEYAEATGADLIVVGTHCRKGVNRFFLGSFAESLLLHSRVPLLVVGRHSRVSGKVSRIFFPTDLQPASEKVFRHVLAFAKPLGAEVRVFHRLYEPKIFPKGKPLPEDWIEMLDRREGETLEDLKQYEIEAREAGVPVEIVLERSDRHESEAILSAAAESGADLIAMAAQSGSLITTFAGSTTRQVVRGADRPVWAIHSHRLAAASAAAAAA